MDIFFFCRKKVKPIALIYISFNDIENTDVLLNLELYRINKKIYTRLFEDYMFLLFRLKVNLRYNVRKLRD